MLHQALSHSRHCKIAEPCGHQLSEGTEHALESLRLETSCLLQSRPLREVDGHSAFPFALFCFMYFKTSNPERSEAGSCSQKLQLTCPEAESTGQTEDDKHPKEVFILLSSQ